MSLKTKLLPLVARHFPLTDVDIILGAFADIKSSQKSDWEEA